MKINKIANNMTEAEVKGVKILFSYSTPVAAKTVDGYLVTKKKWSVTTSRHISKWLGGVNATPVSQETINALAQMKEEEGE